jgi:uncharacterized protein YndB with AHSA1/START domain
MIKISIETTVNAPVESVWNAWTNSDDIVRWNAANDDWHTPTADIDLKPGGSFNYRMEAKDGSMGFDFTGTFKTVHENQRIEFVMDDNREVIVEFIPDNDAVIVRESFDAESENDAEMQRQGWQAILNNFAKHVESTGQPD